MAKYRYAGPGPIEVLSGGEVTRPGDVREFEAEPTWGPWDLIEDAEETAETPPVTPVTPAPPTPPAIGLSALTTPPAGTEGM